MCSFCLQEIFGIPWKEISNQITKLRQILSQNVKKTKALKSGQSTDDLFKPTWLFWKQLQFLVPVMNARHSRDSLPTLPDENSVNSPTKVEIPDDEDTPPTSAPTSVVTQKAKPVKQGRKDQSPVKEELMMECLRIMKTPESSVSGDFKAESSFGVYITEKLKLLDNRRRMIAEKRITDIIWELQMDMEQSVSDSSFTSPQPPNPMAAVAGYSNPTLTNFLQWCN